MQLADVGDLRGRVPGLLPGAAGGSGERGHFWHEQQNTAAYNFRRSIGRLAHGLSPVYTRQTRSDFLQLDQHHNGGGSDKVKQESTKKRSVNFSTASFQ